MPENSHRPASPPAPHTLMLDNRKTLTLTGVRDVPGFDENTVSVKLDDASLVVKGSSLHISRLNLESGDVTVDGLISSLQYLSSAGKSIRSKLLR